MSRLAWLSLLLPIGCFSESDPELTSGADSSDAGSESTAGTSSSAGETVGSTASTSAEVTGTSVDTGEDTRPTTSTADDASTTSDTGEACPEGTVEIPPVPIGWDAVFTLSPSGLGDEIPVCPPMLGDVGVVIEDPVAQPCSCNCNPACWVYTDFDGDCVDFADIVDGVFDESCANFAVAPAHVSFDHDLASNAGCATPDATPSIAGARRRVCEHTDGTPCVAAPPEFSAPCVRHDGDVPCPAGPYSVKAHTGVSIDVTCTPCESCLEAAMDACVASTASLFSEPDCMGTETPVSNLACSPESGASLRVDFDLVCPAATVDDQAAQGERTYCCVP